MRIKGLLAFSSVFKAIPHRNYIQNVTILTLHLLSIYALFFTPVTMKYLVIFLISVYLRLFFVSAGIHRYFSHKSFYLKRWSQFVFAVLCSLCLQNSVFWWAARHRRHHKKADSNEDPHFHKKGFFWSHIGWIMADDDQINPKIISDLYNYPELVFIHKYYQVLNFLFPLAIYFIFGFNCFLWVYCLGTVASWHLTFIVNSIGHKVGYRNFSTSENSKNISILNILTIGESLHNNHHARPSYPNNKVLWHELDLTYCGLWVLSLIGIVKFRKNHVK